MWESTVKETAYLIIKLNATGFKTLSRFYAIFTLHKALTLKQ